MSSRDILTWTPDAIVFDYDGTLMDTERHWQTARALTAEEFGFETQPGFTERSVGLHYTECGHMLAMEAGQPELSKQVTTRLLDHFRVLAADAPRTMPGARELLVSAAKFAPLAVASNCPQEVVEEGLAVAGLRGYFGAVVVPGHAIRPKPHPDVYIAAARQCGAAPEDTLAVEDSRCGVQAATRAGLRVLGVGPWPGEDLAACVDLWVTSLDEPRVFAWASDRVARRMPEK